MGDYLELETIWSDEIAMPAVRICSQGECRYSSLLNDRSAMSFSSVKEQGSPIPLRSMGLMAHQRKPCYTLDRWCRGTVAQIFWRWGDRVMEVIQDMADGKSYQKEITIPVQMTKKYRSIWWNKWQYENLEVWDSLAILMVVNLSLWCFTASFIFSSNQLYHCLTTSPY